jgi:hypothetical protein
MASDPLSGHRQNFEWGDGPRYCSPTAAPWPSSATIIRCWIC